MFSLLLILLSSLSMHLGAITKPNIILIVADDLGYGDLASYGHPTQEWGTIDWMASRGRRFTQAYAASSMCTSSRAALLTGRLPPRTGVYGTDKVFSPHSSRGLPHSELTIAEVMKSAGYRTGIVGKWHLGTNSFNRGDGAFLPHTQGFDYVGSILPYSLAYQCDDQKRHRPTPTTKLCYLYQNSTIVQQPLRTDTLTPTLVDDIKAFISESSPGPFFLYLPLLQPHASMFNMPKFRAKSRRGIYGDQINELSWAVKETLLALNKNGVGEDTLVVFTSDHGPQLELCEESGTSGYFRGGKGYWNEGSVRVPLIAYWPGVISPGVSRDVVSLMDILPTFASIGGADIPRDRRFDGHNIADALLKGHSVRMKPLAFYHDTTLIAIRYSHYKAFFHELPLPSSKKLTQYCNGSSPTRPWLSSYTAKLIQLQQPKIFNVDADLLETTPLNNTDYSDVVEMFIKFRDSIESTMEDIPPPQMEPEYSNLALYPCCNYPYCVCDKINKRSYSYSFFPNLVPLQ